MTNISSKIIKLINIGKSNKINSIRIYNFHINDLK